MWLATVPNPSPCFSLHYHLNRKHEKKKNPDNQTSVTERSGTYFLALFSSFSFPFVTRCLFNLPTAQLHKSFYKLAQRSAFVIGVFFLQTWNSSVYSQWCQDMVLCRLGVQLRYRSSSFTRRNQSR